MLIIIIYIYIWNRYCEPDTLDKKLVENKIVLCDGFTGEGALYAGAFGYVLTSRRATAVLDPAPLPAASVWFHIGNEITYYINSTRYQYLRMTMRD